ncbi:MAG: glycosyltransferase family 2 protein [Geminicoccales bacterium]
MVTLSFNQGQFLETALRSVIEQDYPDLDYIVVDPGSTDGSREIIERYRSALSHVVFEPDDGPADGLNRGFSLADGAIFGFLNADDFLKPGALKSVAKAFERFGDADVIAAHGWLVDEAGIDIRRKYSNSFNAWRYLYQGAYLLQQSTFFREHAYKAVQGFNAQNRTCWDGELWLDMALAGHRFQILDEFWSAFRVYEGSITGSVAGGGSHQQRYKEDRARMFQEAMGRPPAGLPYQAQRLAALLLKWGSNPVALKDRFLSLFDARSRRAPI